MVGTCGVKGAAVQHNALAPRVVAQGVVLAWDWLVGLCRGTVRGDGDEPDTETAREHLQLFCHAGIFADPIGRRLDEKILKLFVSRVLRQGGRLSMGMGRGLGLSLARATARHR